MGDVSLQMRAWSAYLQALACGFRAGIVPPWQAIELTFADLEDVHNVFIVGDTPSTKEASRGVAREDRPLFLREQYDAPGFPWPDVKPDDALYAEAFSALDNRPRWFRQE